MKNTNSPLSTHETCPRLTNPLFMVLSGSEIRRKHKLLEQVFGNMNGEYMTAWLYENSAGELGGDNLIPLPALVDTACLQAFAPALDAAIRKTKQHKFLNNNDLTVCLFLDSTGINTQLDDICFNLYNLLTNAYYNHVFFDIYFLLLEDFVPDTGRRKQNVIAAKQLSKLHGQEWVRYIFLMSDVTSRGQLITNGDELFQMMLTSAFMTNCSMGEESRLLQDILMRETENGKFFCLGKIGLSQSMQELQQMVQAELLHQVSTGIRFNENIPARYSCLAALHTDIRNEVLKQSRKIRYIGCYSDTVPAVVPSLTNLDYLDVFFRENPTIYMDTVETLCRQSFEEKLEQYWRQIKIWLDDLLVQYNASICIPHCEQYAASIAESVLDKLQRQFQSTLGDSRDRFESWKSQKIQFNRNMRRFPVRFAYRLLDKWRGWRSEEIINLIAIECISDIRGRVKFWQEEIVRKCSLFSNLRYKTDSQWETLLRDSTSTKRLLLQYRRDALSAWLSRNDWRVAACRSQLNGLLNKQAGLAEIVSIVSKHVEQLLWEGFYSDLSWYDPMLCDAVDDYKDNELYSELYQTIKIDISLNTRRHIPGAATYLCFFGGTGDRFIDYIQRQKEFQYILRFEDCSLPSEVFCFQHLSSNAPFFWKEQTGGEDGIDEI